MAVRSTSAAQRPGAGRAHAAAPPVLVGKVRREMAPLILEAIGAAEPTRTAAVRSQITGTLLKIAFHEGQTIQQGDLLFELDAAPSVRSI